MPQGCAPVSSFLSTRKPPPFDVTVWGVCPPHTIEASSFHGRSRALQPDSISSSNGEAPAHPPAQGGAPSTRSSGQHRCPPRGRSRWAPRWARPGHTCKGGPPLAAPTGLGGPAPGAWEAPPMGPGRLRPRDLGGPAHGPGRPRPGRPRCLVRGFGGSPLRCRPAKPGCLACARSSGGHCRCVSPPHTLWGSRDSSSDSPRVPGPSFPARVRAQAQGDMAALGQPSVAPRGHLVPARGHLVPVVGSAQAPVTGGGRHVGWAPR